MRFFRLQKGDKMEIKRRQFLGFFLIGGLASLIAKKLAPKQAEPPKEALFWRRKP